MSTVWKVVIGLALTLPIAAYVVGSLVASTTELPAQREPVNIQNGSPPPTSDPHSPSSGPADPRPSASDPAQRDEADEADEADNGVRVVSPEPTPVHDGDDGRGDDGGDEDGGDDGGDDSDDDDTDDRGGDD
jgi:hypothetical protein